MKTNISEENNAASYGGPHSTGTPNLHAIARYIRALCVEMTTHAGSGHLTSSLSATDVMVRLVFGGRFKFDIEHPDNPNNDRLIFSKGHASPLFYALWAVAGGFPVSELNTFRKLNSNLEGHPSMAFPFTEAVTGSLGQGLSIGVGIALHAKRIAKLPYHTYVLLGDSEMSEGSNWEAMQLAAHYQLDNLTGIIDMNRLGQRGETMYGRDARAYENMAESFGWRIGTLDELDSSEQNPDQSMPTLIVADTLKGASISFLEDKEGWHGRTLTHDEADKALHELGYSWDNPPSRQPVTAHVPKPASVKLVAYTPPPTPARDLTEDDDHDEPLATRKAYGHALVRTHPRYPDMVVLDAEVSNSTYSNMFQKAYPDRFFEMFIAEQNMAGVAVGLASRGSKPCISTFAAFFTRAHDQLRIAAYSGSNIVCVGSHAGVSIGEDGPTQMGLEDIALFRSLLNSVVVEPADHIATEKILPHLLEHKGLSYMRLAREDRPPLYDVSHTFVLGGSHTHHSTNTDTCTLIATGSVLFEALAAYEELFSQHNIHVRVIDAYSIKPIDESTIRQAALETRDIITIEDHYAQGGLGEAVRSALSDRPSRVHSLAVTTLPRSGTPAQLRDAASISATHIIDAVLSITSRR